MVRIKTTSTQLIATSEMNVENDLGKLIKDVAKEELGNVQNFLPEAVGLSIRPNDGKTYTSSFSMAIDVKFNNIEAINDLVDATSLAHSTILASLSKNLILRSIHNDLKPFRC